MTGFLLQPPPVGFSNIWFIDITCTWFFFYLKVFHIWIESNLMNWYFKIYQYKGINSEDTDLVNFWADKTIIIKVFPPLNTFWSDSPLFYINAHFQKRFDNDSWYKFCFWLIVQNCLMSEWKLHRSSELLKLLVFIALNQLVLVENELDKCSDNNQCLRNWN